MPRSVSIKAGAYNIELPNGVTYQATNRSGAAGPTVILTDDEFALIGTGFASVLVDNGNVGTSTVTTQAAHVAAAAAITTANASAATATDPTQTGTSVSITPVAEGDTGLDLESADWTTLFTAVNATVTDVGHLVTQVDALITDVASIRTEFDRAVTDITAVHTTLNAELAALQVAGGPQEAS